MKKDHNKPVIALDIGGTKIRTALVSYRGNILVRYQCLTNAEKGRQFVINRMIQAINIVVTKSGYTINELGGISLAVAGALDVHHGLVTSSPHLPHWKNIPIRDIVSDAFNIKTCLINDASAAAVGEHRYGAGQGTTNMIYLTVSTGIGGGIIIDNTLYTGTDGSAGEFGHITIVSDGPQCACGNKGCLEMYASGSAIERETKRIIEAGSKSLISSMVGSDVNKITAKIVAKAALRKDRVAVEVITKTSYYLGIGLANIVNIFNPEMIVIGGGLSNLGERLLHPARKIIKERAFDKPANTVKVVRSKLGDNAGLIGAAMSLYNS